MPLPDVGLRPRTVSSQGGGKREAAGAHEVALKWLTPAAAITIGVARRAARPRHRSGHSGPAGEAAALGKAGAPATSPLGCPGSFDGRPVQPKHLQRTDERERRTQAEWHLAGREDRGQVRHGKRRRHDLDARVAELQHGIVDEHPVRAAQVIDRRLRA